MVILSQKIHHQNLPSSSVWLSNCSKVTSDETPWILLTYKEEEKYEIHINKLIT